LGLLIPRSPRPFETVRQFPEPARGVLEHPLHLGARLLFRVLLGLHAGYARGLGRILKFVVAEVEGWHGESVPKVAGASPTSPRAG
jgi:hypothetical protein